MSKLTQMLCGATLAALLPLAACSSSGRVNLGGNVGDGPGGGGSGGPSSPGNPNNPNTTPPAASNPTLGGQVTQTVEPVLVSTGNLVGGIVPAEVGQAADPLARVTIVDSAILGRPGATGPTAIGLSIDAATRNQSQLATLGVLQNGHVVGANALGGSNTGLIGTTLGGDQLIGLGLLSPNDGRGDAADINILTGGQILDVELNGAQGQGGLLSGVTDGLHGLLNHD